jgi:LacI family transcriptional regulator
MGLRLSFVVIVTMIVNEVLSRPFMTKRPHVALIVETSIHYGRQILRGVTRYLRSHQSWSVFLEQRELWTAPPPWLRRWHGDGVICRKTTPQLAQMLAKAGVPLVDLNDRCPPLGAPKIESDHRAIGVLAADHLIERGFRHFAFCGFGDQLWSKSRREGFVSRLGERGQNCQIWESPWDGPVARSWEREQTQIARWLESLPVPVGLMACSDMRGQHVLDACQRLDRAVPEEIAVIGVDDDAVLCNLCYPPLSSVVPNPERVGYEAASLLDRLMRGEPAPATVQRIEPVGVQARQSTEVLAIDDPAVAATLRFIRERAFHECSMKDVLKHAAMSRSLLERRFRQYLGHSPQAEIRSVQLKRVKQLLAESDLPLSEIAGLAGYAHPEYMSVVFKRITGQTPGQFRAASNPEFAAKAGRSAVE